MPGKHFCPRCDTFVRAIEPWRGWKPLWNVWKVGFVLILVFAPFLASDFCVMLPCTMLYLASGGILRGYAREKPVCRVCSLELGDDQHAGTTFRRRRRA